jgi:hypothetical protein
MLNRRLILLIGALLTVVGLWLVVRRPTPTPFERTPDTDSDLTGAAPVPPAAPAGAPTTGATVGAPPPAPPEPAPAPSPADGGVAPERLGAQPPLDHERVIPRADHYVHPDGGIRFKDTASMRRFLHR